MLDLYSIEIRQISLFIKYGSVHFVVKAKGIKEISVPSKLCGVMAAGKAVFGVLDEGSEAMLIIEECRCGGCIESGKYDLSYNQLKKAINESDEYLLLSKNIVKKFFVKMKYSKGLC